MSASASRLPALLERLDALRLRLEEEGEDPDRALVLLAELNDLARELSEELERTRRAALEGDDDD